MFTQNKYIRTVEQSKFIKTFQKLSNGQRQRYLDFLQSPYFNKNEDIKNFVALLFKGNVPLKKEELYPLLYPEKPYDARRIPDLMYKSLRLLEEFLGEEQYAGQYYERKLNVLSYIRTNEIWELHSVIQREIQDLNAKKPLRDSNYFYEEFLFQSEADKIFRDQAQIKADESLQKMVDQLDCFYLSAKLRESCEMMNRKAILSADFEFHLLDKLLEAINANLEKYALYPAISIYYHILLTYREPGQVAHFYALKDEVRQNIHFFAQDEQRSLYGFLQNYCIRKVNSGESEFYRELLDIYQYMMGVKLMDSDNKNLQWDLKNMVSIALRLGEYDWTFGIINDLKNKLPEDARENAYTYNLANYCYETKDFKKATKLLQSVDFKDVYYNLDSKSMLLKIYFELEEEEAFFALVSTFKAYLTRNKLISVARVTSYNNMLKFAQKIFAFKIQLPYERKRNLNKIKTLRDKLTLTKNTANLNWLLKQAEAIVEEQ